MDLETKLIAKILALSDADEKTLERIMKEVTGGLSLLRILF